MRSVEFYRADTLADKDELARPLYGGRPHTASFVLANPIGQWLYVQI